MNQTHTKIHWSDVRLQGGGRALAAILGGVVGVSALLFILLHFLPQHIWWDDGQPVTHTGFDHAGIAPVLFMLVIAGFAAALAFRPRFGVGLGGAIATPFLALAALVALFNLDHLFERVQGLAAEALQGYAYALVFFGGLATVIAHPILFVVARRRVRRSAA
jgi:hypothetical protein